jgi:hypothetical protein
VFSGANGELRRLQGAGQRLRLSFGSFELSCRNHLFLNQAAGPLEIGLRERQVCANALALGARPS